MDRKASRERRTFMFEKLVGIITNYVEVDAQDVKPESRFMEDLGFTSFDFVKI